MEKQFEPSISSKNSSSTENLLKSKGEVEDEYYEGYVALRRQNRKGWGRYAMPVAIHTGLMVLYTFVTLYLLHRNNESWKHGPGLIYTPARHAHEYERIKFDGDFTSKNPYKGNSSLELDEAWGRLLINSNIVVQKEDLDKINKTSVPVKDGTGYMVTLDVHHQIHCIKQIRRYLHPEYYTMDEPNIETHIEHCLDDLRQMIMCKADMSLLTYEWIPEYHKPFPVWSITHECTNWEKLDQWAGEHVLDMDNIPVHPELRGETVDYATMSSDAKYFIGEVRKYEANKKKQKEAAALEAAKMKAMKEGGPSEDS